MKDCQAAGALAPASRCAKRVNATNAGAEGQSGAGPATASKGPTPFHAARFLLVEKIGRGRAQDVPAAPNQVLSVSATALPSGWGGDFRNRCRGSCLSSTREGPV